MTESSIGEPKSIGSIIYGLNSEIALTTYANKNDYDTIIDSNEPNDIRHCSTLLTRPDCIQLFGLAVGYQEPIKYLITYGTSGNTDGYQVGFMDISPAVEILGYRPKDNLIQTHRHLGSSEK